MRRNIRRGVWETNSSSVHTISIDKSGLEPSELPIKNGKIQIDFGSFDKEEKYYSSQYDKLSYLITCCYYICGYGLEDIYECWTFRDIERIVCKYAGADGIEILNKAEPYIDHQSRPESDIEIINMYHDEEIINFVFNRYISLKTESD